MAVQLPSLGHGSQLVKETPITGHVHRNRHELTETLVINHSLPR